MLKTNQRDDRIFRILLGFLLLAILYLFFTFPLSGDDWNRVDMKFLTVSDYMSTIHRQWSNLNGRILGNLLSMLWIGPLSRVLVRILSFGSLFLFFWKWTETRGDIAFAATLSAVLLLPIEVFRETWVWNAGFYNYIPPLVLLLFAVLLYMKTPNSSAFGMLFLQFTLFLSASLFMENITIFGFLLGLGMLGHRIYKKGRPWIALVGFLGALLGSVIMFSSPVYHRVAADADGYRTMAMSMQGLLSTVKGNWAMFSKFLLAGNPLFIVASSVFFLKQSLQDERGRRGDLLLILIHFLMGAGLFYWGNFARDLQMPLLNLLLHLVYYLLLLYFGYRFLGRGEWFGFFVLVMSMALLMGPLMIVTPVGARNFFSPALLHMMILAYLYRMPGRLTTGEKQLVRWVLISLILIRSVFFLIAYTSNYQIYLERIELVRTAIEEKRAEVTVPAYPYPQYIHAPDAEKMNHALYIHSPGDIQILVEGDLE